MEFTSLDSASRRVWRRLLAATAIAALSVGPAGIPAAADPDGLSPASIGSFESGLDGWTAWGGGGVKTTASPTTDSAHSGTGAARLTMELPAEGSGSVFGALGSGGLATRGLAAQELSFWMKSTPISDFFVRIVDGTGESLHHRIWLADLPEPDESGWREVRLSELNSTEHWGGNDDGVFDPPLAEVVVEVNRYQIPTEQRDVPTTVDIDDVLVWTTEAVPALALSSLAVGNVFTTGDDVAVGISSSARNVEWTVRNAYGAVVDSGSASPAELAGHITLELGPGYYDVDVTATPDSGLSTTARTHVAVLDAFDHTLFPDAHRIGASVHYGSQDWSLDTVPLMTQAGFGHARDEAWWWDEESERGVHEWQPHQLAFADAFEQQGLDLLLILAYGNTSLYPHVGDMTTDEGRKAFARYAGRAVEQFSQYDPTLAEDSTVYEVWNEWNNGSLGAPCPADQLAECVRGSNYFHTLKDTYEAIKAEEPDAFVVGGGQAGYNGGWFTELFEAGGYDYLDAISFHPYTWPGGPEPLIGYIDDANSRMSAHAGADNVKPILLTEHGWPTGTSGRSVDEFTQANDLVRAMAISLAKGVERYTIYNLIDNGLDLNYTEHNFGILHHADYAGGAYTPKAAYVAAGVFTRQVAGREALRIERPVDQVYNAVFSGETETDSLNVLWATSPRTVQVHTATPVLITDQFGTGRIYTPQSGTITLDLSETALYVAGEVSDITLGGSFSLNAAATVVGEDIAATIAADNSRGADELNTIVEIEGQQVPLSVGAGQSAVAEAHVAGLDAEGSRTLVAVITSDGEAVARLSQQVDVVEPLEVNAVHAVTPNDEHVLRIRLSNDSLVDLDVDALSWDIGGTSGEQALDLSVGAKSVEVVDLPISNPQDETPYSVTVTPASGSAMTVTGRLLGLTDTVHTISEYTVEIDGAVDAALADLPAVDLAEVGTPPTASWDGPEDLSGRAWYTWDEQHLYFTAEITDDVHSQPYSGQQTWQGDGVQLTFSAGTPGEQEGWSELGIALSPTGPSVWRWSSADGQTGEIEDAQYAAVRDETSRTTVYELAVPWDRLAPMHPEDRLVSTSFVVNEDDGAGRSGWFTWGGGIADSKSSARFNPALLATESKPEPTEEPTPEPSEEPSPEPSEEPSEEPTSTPTSGPAPTVVPTSAPRPVDIYSTPGFHVVNGRHWYTACEPYSQTMRCRTEIWSTQIRPAGGSFVQRTGWNFNNLTYLPLMSRAQWADNPLGKAGTFNSEGRQWRTECDTATTGRNGCRSYIWTDLVKASRSSDGRSTYRATQDWVFNNIVRFR